MEKDKFQPIVMPCTKEQYESLVPVLEQNEISIARNKNNYPYSSRITNYFAKYKNFVSRTYISDAVFKKDIPEVKIYKRFNRKIFLKSLGIIEEPEFVLPEKWCIKCDNIQELNLVTKHLYGRELKIDHQSYISKYGLNNHPGHSMYNFWNYPEITFEQFLKYVFKQDLSLLESQSVTNKQTKMKTSFQKDKRESIHIGNLVEVENIIGIVYAVNNCRTTNETYEIIILHGAIPSKGKSLGYNMIGNIENTKLVKGKLTLEQ